MLAGVALPFLCRCAPVKGLAYLARCPLEYFAPVVPVRCFHAGTWAFSVGVFHRCYHCLELPRCQCHGAGLAVEVRHFPLPRSM